MSPSGSEGRWPYYTPRCVRERACVRQCAMFLYMCSMFHVFVLCLLQAVKFGPVLFSPLFGLTEIELFMHTYMSYSYSV